MFESINPCNAKHKAAIVGALTAVTPLGLIVPLEYPYNTMVSGIVTEAICKGGVPTMNEAFNSAMLSTGGGMAGVVGASLLGL